MCIRDRGYHVEYGYSCMGYELPGAMGVKLAAPEREVFVMIGDGSYLMLPGELATAVAERIKLIVVLVQNHGYASIGALSRSIGSGEFGTHYPPSPDLAANAESLGLRAGSGCRSRPIRPTARAPRSTRSRRCRR